MLFVNSTQGEVFDVSSELFREYFFPCGLVLRIKRPLKLSVSESGGHSLFDENGTSHYVSEGWIKLRLTAKDGARHFVA